MSATAGVPAVEPRSPPTAERPDFRRAYAEHRARETVVLVSSDFALRGTSGQEVQKRSSREFAGELGQVPPSEPYGH